MISSLRNKMAAAKKDSPKTNQSAIPIISNTTNYKSEENANFVENMEKLKLTEKLASPAHSEIFKPTYNNIVNKHSEPKLIEDACPLGRFIDEPEYRMNNPKRGVALIINNKRFEARTELGTREGTDKDAAALEFSLNKLGFDIKIYHNCTAKFMRDLLFKLARADHSGVDCFLCVIMSHGDEGVIYGVDREIEIDMLLQPFKQNRTLAGKPKLFFIQACRGSNFVEGIDSNPYEVNYVNKIPVEADFLLAYSTIAGHYSWRNSGNGSWFIQSLCQEFNENGRQKELMKLLTAVNRRVAYNFESNTNDKEMSGKRQIPCIVSMLTKEVYFKPKLNQLSRA